MIAMTYDEKSTAFRMARHLERLERELAAMRERANRSSTVGSKILALTRLVEASREDLRRWMREPA